MHRLARRFGFAVSLWIAVLGGCSGGGGSDAPKRPQPPAAPAALLATPGDGQVTLSWGAVSSATSYAVYWSTSPGVSKSSGTKVAGATSPWTHAGRANGTTYYYVVTALNAGGESAESPQASAVPAVNPAPAAPSGVTAAPGDGKVTLTWPAVAGATSYTVYWLTSAGVTKANGTAIAGVTSPYVHDGLADGTAYHYVVTASNANGESVASNEVSATPVAPPAAPGGVTAYAGDGQVTISWSPVSGADSYALYCSTTAGVTKLTGTRIAPVTSPYVHGGRTNGTTYYYVVTAVNAGGESVESGAVSATPSASAIPPDAPAGVVATAGDGSVKLSWNAVSGATSYNVYASISAGVAPSPDNRIQGVSRPYVDTGLWNGTTYHYVVTSVNGFGESPPSSEVSATPLYAGHAISGSIAGSGTGRIYLVADAGGYGNTTYTSGTSIAAPGAFTIRGVHPGTYTIRAFQDGLGYAQDNAQFAHWVSDPVTVTTADVGGVTLTLQPPAGTGPVTPTGLAIVAGDGAAMVQWTPNFSGYVETVTGYDVAWGPDAAASTSTVHLDARMAPYLLLELPTSQSFYFRVRSRIGATASGWSAATGPITIGPAAGGHTVSGTATLPVDATGPLYAVLCATYPGSTCRLGHVASPARSQAYTVAGVPDGTYQVELLVDQDRDGLLDLGDLVAQDYAGVVVSGADATKDLTFPTVADAKVSAPTSRTRWATTGLSGLDEYWRSPSVEDDRKLVVATTLLVAKGLTVPIDLARQSNMYAGSWLPTLLGSPAPGEVLRFALTYADGSTAIIDVPAVALDFPRALTVTPTPSAVVPTFSWTAPATPPAGPYGYRIGVSDGGVSWSYPALDPWMPSTQLSVQFDVDGGASPHALTPGVQIYWNLEVADSAGNSAEVITNYTPPP